MTHAFVSMNPNLKPVVVLLFVEHNLLVPTMTCHDSAVIIL
jgi:hypothetical protein